MNKIVSKFRNGMASLRKDEAGAESSEVILVLVLLVIGLFTAWRFIQSRLQGRATTVGNCIQNPSTGSCQ